MYNMNPAVLNMLAMSQQPQAINDPRMRTNPAFNPLGDQSYMQPVGGQPMANPALATAGMGASVGSSGGGHPGSNFASGIGAGVQKGMEAARAMMGMTPEQRGGAQTMALMAIGAHPRQEKDWSQRFLGSAMAANQAFAQQQAAAQALNEKLMEAEHKKRMEEYKMQKEAFEYANLSEKERLAQQVNEGYLGIAKSKEKREQVESDSLTNPNLDLSGIPEDDRAAFAKSKSIDSIPSLRSQDKEMDKIVRYKTTGESGAEALKAANKIVKIIADHPHLNREFSRILIEAEGKDKGQFETYIKSKLGSVKDVQKKAAIEKFYKNAWVLANAEAVRIGGSRITDMARENAKRTKADPGLEDEANLDLLQNSIDEANKLVKRGRIASYAESHRVTMPHSYLGDEGYAKGDREGNNEKVKAQGESINASPLAKSVISLTKQAFPELKNEPDEKVLTTGTFKVREFRNKYPQFKDKKDDDILEIIVDAIKAGKSL